MSQGQDTKPHKKWEQLKEVQRYKIEALDRAGLTATAIAEQIGRDRRIVERELARGSVVQRRENPYASRNPEVPEYLEEQRYCADAGQRVKEERASNKGRGLKIGSGHDLVRHIEKRLVRKSIRRMQ